MSKNLDDLKQLSEMSESEKGDLLDYFDQRPWLKEEYERQTGNKWSDVDPRERDTSELQEQARRQVEPAPNPDGYTDPAAGLSIDDGDPPSNLAGENDEVENSGMGREPEIPVDGSPLVRPNPFANAGGGEDEGEDGYDSWSVDELKDEIRLRNEDEGREEHLALSGNKSELVARLEADDEASGE